jgi:hypothetical protein
MEDDDGNETEFHSVIVPLSLIHALTFEMLHTIDQWHEDRQIDVINHRQCFAAMMAAVEAAMEQLDNNGPEVTLQ